MNLCNLHTFYILYISRISKANYDKYVNSRAFILLNILEYIGEVHLDLYFTIINWETLETHHLYFIKISILRQLIRIKTFR